MRQQSETKVVLFPPRAAADFGRKTSSAASYDRLIGNDVVSFSGMDLGDAQHTGFKRINLP